LASDAEGVDHQIKGAAVLVVTHGSRLFTEYYPKVMEEQNSASS
jgi:hypothetical protein